MIGSDARYYHPELVRLAFVLGIVVSILFYERRHLTTGGIAVPGYLGFVVVQPLIVPAIFAAPSQPIRIELKLAGDAGNTTVLLPFKKTL